MESTKQRRRRERRARLGAAGTIEMMLPAGLEASGRDEELTHDPGAHPSGARADHRHSVPGTGIPGGPRPAAASGEVERTRRGAS